ncbi:MAG: ABC transporter substrate-binding protein, partial [Alphaproteobacteria bacterium]|nr:ABC transporter substrate-binding protein [Alphaproteobacteria bacterium]
MTMELKRRELMAGGGAALATASVGTTASAQAGRVMVIACNSEIPSFDPHVSSGYASSMLMRNVYSSMVTATGNPARIEPQVAKSWTISPDGLTYTFEIDPTARFHDGSPITADDVVYSFRRLIRLGRGGAWMVAGILDQDSIKADGPGKAVFTLRRPFAAFLQVLPWMSVINSKLIEANKGSDDGQAYFVNNAPGSGAFQLTRSEPGNLFEFRRVKDSWRKGGGNLDAYIWKITRETTTQRLMIQQGQAHAALDLTSEDIDALKGRPGVNLILESDYRTFTIKMNCKKGPLADVNLRRAISYAYDYDAMLQIAGYAELMQGPLPTGIFGFDPAVQVPRHDIAKAKEFLAKSTHPNGGVKLRAAFITGLEHQRRWLLVMLDKLRALNIELDIVSTAWTDAVAAARSPDLVADFFCVYQSVNYADPDN